MVPLRVKAPLPEETERRLQGLLGRQEPGDAALEVQKLLDAHCLVGVNINPESRVKATRGPAAGSYEDAAGPPLNGVASDDPVRRRTRMQTRDPLPSYAGPRTFLRSRYAEIAELRPGMVAVVGVPHSKWGETPIAVVALKDGEQATGDDLISYARERLAHFKCPSRVEYLPELPRNATGKVLKTTLRKEFGGRETAVQR